MGQNHVTLLRSRFRRGVRSVNSPPSLLGENTSMDETSNSRHGIRTLFWYWMQWFLSVYLIRVIQSGSTNMLAALKPLFPGVIPGVILPSANVGWASWFYCGNFPRFRSPIQLRTVNSTPTRMFSARAWSLTSRDWLLLLGCSSETRLRRTQVSACLPPLSPSPSVTLVTMWQHFGVTEPTRLSS